MKDIAGVAVIALAIVLFGLLVDVISSCQAYDACLKAHSIKTCKANFGKDGAIEESDY